MSKSQSSVVLALTILLASSVAFADSSEDRDSWSSRFKKNASNLASSIKTGYESRRDRLQDGLDGYRSRASSSISPDYERFERQSQQITGGIKERALQSYDHYRRKSGQLRSYARQYGRDVKAQMRDSYDQYKHKSGQYYEAYKRSNFNRAIGGTIRNIRQDPTLILILTNSVQHATLEVAASGIKNIPVYDPTDRSVKSYDTLIRDLLIRTDATLPPAIAEDPVRAFVFLSLDDDYLLEAKLIRRGDEWLSLNDLLISEEHNLWLKAAMRSHQDMVNNFRAGRYEILAQRADHFSNQIDNLNKEMSSGGLNSRTIARALYSLRDNAVYRSAEQVFDDMIPSATNMRELKLREQKKHALAAISLTVIGLSGLVVGGKTLKYAGRTSGISHQISSAGPLPRCISSAAEGSQCSELSWRTTHRSRLGRKSI
jgi:hypothetical protein